MPGVIESNPLFANNPPGALLTPQEDDWWGLDPSISLSTLAPTVAHLGANVAAPGAGIGLLVEIQGWNGVTSSASGSPTHPTVALSGTTSDGAQLGAIQGTTTSLTPVSVVGQAVKVRRFGIGLVVVDNTTVIGHTLVPSTGTAGTAHDSGAITPVAGGIGTALQALTVGSGLGIVYALFKLT